MTAAGTRQRIELRAAVVLRRLPLGCDPAFVLELVQRRVERAIAHLQNVVGNLVEPLADRPAVEGLEREDFQDEQVERALHEVSWSTHGASTRLPMATIASLHSVIKRS